MFRKSLAAFLSVMFVFSVFAEEVQEVDKGKHKKNMYYGKTKWGMTPKQVDKVLDYNESKKYKHKKETSATYNMKYKTLLVEASFWYANHNQLYLIIFEFGNVIPITDFIDNTITVSSRPPKREKKEKMLHFFGLLVDMYSKEFGKGELTDNSKGDKFNMEHIWQNDKAFWRVHLETDKKGYHRLYLTAWNKDLNDQMKGRKGRK